YVHSRTSASALYPVSAHSGTATSPPWVSRSRLTVTTLRLVGLICEINGPNLHLLDDFWLDGRLRQPEASPSQLSKVIRKPHRAPPKKIKCKIVQKMCKPLR